MIVWSDKLESHVGGFDLVLVEGRYFVIEDLVFWYDALVIHMNKCALTGQNHFLLCFVFDSLHPSGVAVDVVEEYLILVAAAGALWELASLVCVGSGVGLIACDKDVVLLQVWFVDREWKVGGDCAGFACGGGFRLGGQYLGVYALFFGRDTCATSAKASPPQNSAYTPKY